MAVTARIAELERRHRQVEREIESAQTHPAADPLEVLELKRKKLKLKDSIEKLKLDTSVH